MEDEETELRNPFPSPPSHYTRYTTHNLNLLKLYKEQTANYPPDQLPDQQEALSDQKDVPDWSLLLLDKPRVDWILEDGSYNVFGDTWFVRIIDIYSSFHSFDVQVQVKENIPSLGELGGQQLYPEDPTVGVS